jgi:hypothetical protein
MLRQALAAVRDTAVDRRVSLKNAQAFAALVAAPGNLATGFQLPAAADLWASSSGIHAVVKPMITANTTRTLSGDVGAANVKHHVGYFERGVTVKKAAGAVGTISLYFKDWHGDFHLFGQG